MIVLKYMTLILFVFLNFVNVLSQCDYSKCNKLDSNKLNVHLVPHTHDDVGWLKTIDQYYYGSRTNIQRAGVQYIIDSVVKSLAKSPQRKFIYVETAFFWKWWNQQNESTKSLVHHLVQNGQLEFIGGGWSMNDEGAAHYNNIIDQMTWGFRRLNDTFGKCGIPKIGWQIDPFGHSREQASLFAQMNFDGFFFARIDYEDKANREKLKTLEMVWDGSDDLGKSSSIFSNVMDRHYSAPSGFCFDLALCNDEPLIDDPNSEDYNVDKRVNDFVLWAKSFASNYVTNNIMVPMGDDFMYENAEAYFLNIDKLIKYVNAKSNLNVFYSTPSCYAYAIHNANRTLSIKTDDFFPYGDVPHSYIVGYFTSRPTHKYYDRYSNNFLQICKQLDTLTLLNGTDDRIAKLREALGEMQHHDAITGTEKQPVADDYALRITKGISKCESVVQSAFEKLMIKDKTNSPPKQMFCRLLNVSACPIIESKNFFTVTIYNPIGREVSQYVSIPVTMRTLTDYKVTGPDGNNVPFEVMKLPEYVLNIPGRNSTASSHLQFKAQLPPLGFNTYFVTVSAAHKFLNKFIIGDSNDNFSVKGKGFTVNFDGKSGAINSIELNNGPKIDLKQTFQYYKAKHTSSAYGFGPDGTIPINLSNKIKYKYSPGKLSTEIQQTYIPWIGQTIRVYPDEDYVEFDWVIGPIPFDDGISKEIIIKFDSDLNTNKTFYTDSNGRQMMKRIKDHRDTWNYTVKEPIAGNYYPVNSRIAIKDPAKDVQLTILSDRSQGGSSINDGSIEILIHRRLLCCNGAVEPLNETGVDGRGLVVRGKHYLIPSKIADAAKLHRDFAQRLFMAPLITFTDYANADEYKKSFRTSYTGLKVSLPRNVHLLTLEQWRLGTYLLRIEHFYESTDDPNGLSKPVTVKLRDLFAPFVITAVDETTLGANELLGLRKRLEFRTLIPIKDVELTPISGNDYAVTLKPMQIRTFIISVKNNA